MSIDTVPILQQGAALQGLTKAAKIRNLPARLQKTAARIGVRTLMADNAAVSLCGFFVSTPAVAVMGKAWGASQDAPLAVRAVRQSSCPCSPFLAYGCKPKSN